MKTFFLCTTLFLLSVTAVSAETVTGSNTNSNSDALSTSINVINQNFEASKPVPGMPGSISGPVISPSLFNITGRPAQITGLPLWSQRAFIPKIHDRANGKSGGTTIVYNGITPRNAVKSDEGEISLNLTGVAEGTMVGSLTIESKKNHADDVDIPTLIHDAAEYLEHVDSLRGCQVTLLSVPEAMSFTLGIDSKSQGFSLAPVLSRIFDVGGSLLTGVSVGASTTGGVTSPIGKVGCSFLVIVDSKENRRIDITRDYRNYVAQVNGQPVDHRDGDNEKNKTRAKMLESIEQKTN